jgi:hypothetical protein
MVGRLLTDRPSVVHSAIHIMTTPRLFLLIFCLLLSSAPGQAEPIESYIGRLEKQAIEKKLQVSDEWMALLHYTRSSLFSGLESEVDSADFFLSGINGKSNPRLELVATLRSFFKPVEAYKAPDLHPQCLFPARLSYLKKQLAIQSDQLPSPPCKNFNRFFQTLQTKTITIVYASAYVNSPGSMYGHTFLKFDKHPDDTRKQLLDLTFNFAANANPADNNLLYSLKGLFGGYHGIYTFPTYHEKLKEYNDIENRDVWEYRLNFNSEEINQVIRHIWEIQKTTFFYFFFDENCAYRIVAVLSAGRPSMKIMDRFYFHAIPLNTIRALISGGHVASIQFRPSFTRMIKHYQAQLSDQQNHLALRLAKGYVSVKNEELQAMSDVERSQIFDLSVDYLRQIMESDQEAEIYKKQQETAYQILLARSQIQQPFSLERVAMPPFRDDQGHETTRASVSVGKLDRQPFLDLHYRGTYHSLTDPPGGYMIGSELSFFDFQFRLLRLSETDSRISIHRLDYIRILSVPERDTFFQPYSWKFKISTDDDWITGQSHDFT